MNRALRAALLLAVISLAGCSVLEKRGAVVGCQAADTATTLHGLELGAKEANPVVARLLDRFGPQGFIAVKTGVTLLVLHHYAAISPDLLAVLNGLTCGVAAHNANVASRLQRRAREAPPP